MPINLFVFIIVLLQFSNAYEFSNSVTLYANAGPTPFSLTCDTSLNQEIKWIQSFNRTTFYYVKPSSKYQVSTDGTVLTIINVSLNDEEYFACGYNVNKTFKIIKSYLLYVRVQPSLAIFLNDKLVTENETLNLINDKVTVNKISCVSVLSKPDVNLFLFDTESFISLSTGFNYKLSNTCSENQVCTKIYLVNLVFLNGLFDNMESISCVAKNYQYGLSAEISRRVVLKYKSTTTTTATSTKIVSTTTTMSKSTTVEMTTVSLISTTTSIVPLSTTILLTSTQSPTTTTSLNTSTITLSTPVSISTTILSTTTTITLPETTTIILNTTTTPELTTTTIIPLTTSTLLETTTRIATTTISSSAASTTTITTTISDTTSTISTTTRVKTTILPTSSTVIETTVATVYSTTFLSTSTGIPSTMPINTTSVATTTPLVTTIQIETTKTTPSSFIVTSYSEFVYLLGSSFILECPFATPDYWTYSNNNKTFNLIDKSNKYFANIHGPSLTVSNSSLNDSIYFSCYFQESQAIIYIFLKTQPILFISVNNQLLALSSSISFGSQPNILITCLAVNSRPKIDLKIIDPITLVSLTNQLNKVEICDSFQVCQTSISVQLTPGYAYFNNLKSIACQATNSTTPYEINSVTTSFSLDFNGDSCFNNECKNGTCIVSGSNLNGYECNCNQGYGGSYCNYSSTVCSADLNYCNSNGLCLIDLNGNAQCLCYIGFYGLRCNFNASLCESTCLNNAQCVLSYTNIDGYECKCKAGYKGKNCEESFNPCRNNGLLVLNSSSLYECKCSNGYYGSNCELFNPCYSSPCENNSTCIDLQKQGGYFCACKSGFVGDYCQIDQNQKCVDKYPDLCAVVAGYCDSLIQIGSFCPKTCSLCNDGMKIEVHSKTGPKIVRDQPATRHIRS